MILSDVNLNLEQFVSLAYVRAVSVFYLRSEKPSNSLTSVIKGESRQRSGRMDQQRVVLTGLEGST